MSPRPKLEEPTSALEGVRFPVLNGIPASAPYRMPSIFHGVVQVNMLMLA